MTTERQIFSIFRCWHCAKEVTLPGDDLLRTPPGWSRQRYRSARAELRGTAGEIGEALGCSVDHAIRAALPYAEELLGEST